MYVCNIIKSIVWRSGFGRASLLYPSPDIATRAYEKNPPDSIPPPKR